MHRNGTSKLTLLIAALVVILVAVIVVSALQDARKNAPATGTTPGTGMPTGPSTLGTGYVVRPFSASDLNGHIVDNTFFAKQRLTMVNVWGTFCGPCIREMPDLAQLPGEFPAADFAILGVIADTPDTANEATARQLTGSTGVTYTNVIPDRSIIDRDAGRCQRRSDDLLRRPHGQGRGRGPDRVTHQGRVDERHPGSAGEPSRRLVAG